MSGDITPQEAILLGGRYPMWASFEQRPWLTPTETWFECVECGASLIQSGQLLVNRSITRHYVFHHPDHLAAVRAKPEVTS